MKHVLFVCTDNAGRSQMAQAFFEAMAPADVHAESDGTDRAQIALYEPAMCCSTGVCGPSVDQQLVTVREDLRWAEAQGAHSSRRGGSAGSPRPRSASPRCATSPATGHTPPRPPPRRAGRRRRS
jgi:hypothetical protein